MKDDRIISEFRLFGGPLQQLGRRLGLVRGTNTFWLGVALGLLVWGVLMLLIVLTGSGDGIFSLARIGVHVRFLIAIPLFFLCETWTAPRIDQFVCDIVRSGVVTEKDRPELSSVIRRVGRLKDPQAVEVIFFLIAFGLPLIGRLADIVPSGSAKLPSLLAETGNWAEPALGWYMGFCLPLFRFLILRWLWHLGLWCYFLWRVQKLDLRLIATHPDRSAGLGYLEIVQEHFGTLALAISAVVSASFTEEVLLGTMRFEMLYLLIPMVLLLVWLLFIGPLLVFTPKLWVCRIRGWSDYMETSSQYVSRFDRKWVRGENPSGDLLLGTPDIQSLADLTNSVDVVRAMRWIPAGRRLLISLSTCTILPLLPLFLLNCPPDQLILRLFKLLTGL